MVEHQRCIGCRTLSEERDTIPEGERGVSVRLVPWRDPEVDEFEAEMRDVLAELHPVDDDD